jgi:hypothetical protein
VQVLQAIHLLLAFDLFVVVVAVDARWLHRAVRQVYRGQLDESDQPTQSATVADYLEKIFQLPIWMQPVGDPATVERFVRGLDKPENDTPDLARRNAHTGRDRNTSGTLTPVDAKPDPALHQAAARRRASMSEQERKTLSAMGLLAGKSPRGLKRLVNTYRLIRVMRGPTGIADLEEGSPGKAPLYPYLLFALAGEVGLTTETAALFAEIAIRSAPNEHFHPLLDCLVEDKDLDDAQAQLRKRLDAEGARGAVLTALRAVYVAAAGRDPSERRQTDGSLGGVGDASPPQSDPIFANRNAAGERFAEAFMEAARYTFRPRSRC